MAKAVGRALSAPPPSDGSPGVVCSMEGRWDVRVRSRIVYVCVCMWCLVVWYGENNRDS